MNISSKAPNENGAANRAGKVPVQWRQDGVITGGSDCVRDLARRAFTLTDLLAVIALLAVLTAVVMPTLAGVQNKGGRLECANNLRQIGVASMIFASDNNGWLPVCTLGAGNANGAKTNYLLGIHYTRYVYLGAPNTQITTNEPPVQGEGYQNLGYLFEAGLAGNGNIFYCPGQWGTALGASYYRPLLTTDSTGVIRSSYFYNPRMANAAVSDTIRRYQTVSQMEPHRLFAVDYIGPGNDSGNIDSPSGSGFNPVTMAHARDHGWNVLFTDGSVEFSTLSQDTNYYFNAVVQDLVLSESKQSYIGYDQVFDLLEQDH